MAEPSRRSAAAPNDLEAFWVPFTPNRAFKRAPRLIARAKDMHYYTPENRAVLDGTAGLWCTNAGHNRAPIVEAIKRQAEELDYAPAFQFLAPQNSSASGTGPGARRPTAARPVIGREHGYPGVGFAGISVGGIVSNRKHFGPLLAGVDHLPATYN